MNSRQKGARGERELSRLLRQYGYESRRGQQYSGANGDADVVGLSGVHIECKRVERLNISEAMQQAQRDARDGEAPAVFHRRNREQWLVTMSFDDWIKLYQAAGLGENASKKVWQQDPNKEKSHEMRHKRTAAG